MRSYSSYPYKQSELLSHWAKANITTQSHVAKLIYEIPSEPKSQDYTKRLEK